MPFGYDYSDEVEEALVKIGKKDKTKSEIILKKIEEIVQRNQTTIEYYKNLRNELSDYKRVHVAKSFVIMFKVYKKENFILFDKIKHHDDAYK